MRTVLKVLLSSKKITLAGVSWSASGDICRRNPKLEKLEWEKADLDDLS